ncbi:hypothetical protein ACFYWX_01340 [Streptomyces sp. NPDC002888]|uniref:hypothetical protein n=1 Tax=Streptomyces sp. NPDC002888 TaxID=3364668 RepID=UPI00368E1831
MNGPLNRLLGRSGAPLPGLRPRPAAPYAHRPAGGVVDETPPALADEPVDAPLEEPAAEERPPRGAAAVEEVGERPDPTTPSRSLTDDHFPVVRAKVTGRQQVPIFPVAVTAAEAPPAAALKAAEAPPAAAAPPRGGPSTEPVPVTVMPDHPRLRVGTVPTAPAAAPEADPGAMAVEAAPTVVVEVSIGRLDVRTPPATAAPRPPSAAVRENHAKALETYLRRRAQGDLG